jgi:hypothetical protein
LLQYPLLELAFVFRCGFAASYDNASEKDRERAQGSARGGCAG